jgi:uncharacterized protein (DUF2236 family)
VAPEQADAALLPGPGSLLRRRGGDLRVLGAAGYALLLQVAHPTVAAGVAEHSDYRADPWGRLLRTLDFTNLLVYGTPRQALAAIAELRSSHARFRGRRPDGRSYSALEPEAWAWVHATLGLALVAGHENFGAPLSAAERQGLWSEWQRLGGALGVGPGRLPAEWAAVDPYLEQMIATRLVDSPVVQGVIADLRRPGPPPGPAALRLVWIGARPLSGGALWLATNGLLPAALRQRFGIGFGTVQQGAFRLLAGGLRRSGPLLPRQLRSYGPRYLRWRGFEAEAGR